MDKGADQSIIKVGCCGFARGMKEYFSKFKVVEIQQTFYRPPKVETALRWRREAPSDFEFTIKAWQLVTHHPSSPTYRKAGIRVKDGERYGFFRPSPEVEEAWQKTAQIAKALQARLIVFQCPAKFEEKPEHIENLRRFFSQVKREDFIFVWEPRGNWNDETIRSLCRELDLIHCVDPFQSQPLYGTLRYFRLHGGPGYRHRYSEEELRRLAMMAMDKETYFLFNNIYMYEDALRLIEILQFS